jgi:predicted metallo-beta-lactamase superfamily hydrolase
MSQLPRDEQPITDHDRYQASQLAGVYVLAEQQAVLIDVTLTLAPYHIECIANRQALKEIRQALATLQDKIETAKNMATEVAA